MRRRFVGLMAAAALLAGGVAMGQDSPSAKTVKILRTTNKAQTNNYVTKAWVLENNNPFQVRSYLQKAISVEEGGIFTYLNDTGDGGIVLMICPEYQIPYFDELIGYLDSDGLVASSDGSQRVYRKLKHRSVGDPDFVATMASFLTTDSWVYTDSELNAVYISDAPSGAGTLLNMLDGDLDTPTEQVEIAVTIYEVDVNNDGTLGLDFHAWKNGPGRTLGAAQAFANRQNAPDGIGVGGLPGQSLEASGSNVAYNYSVPSEYFDALAVDGSARIVTETKLSVLNTDVASVFAGDQILYYHVETAGTANGIREGGPVSGNEIEGVLLNEDTGEFDRTLTGTTVDRLGAAEAGITLQISPIIGKESINLDVIYEVVSVTGFDGTGVPTLSTTRTETNVRTPIGQEVIIGGMSRESRIDTSNKVPILGSIPIIGFLFGGTDTLSSSKMVAIVMTPTVKGATSGLTADEEAMLAIAGN